jgi:hypothetical protein
MRYLAEAVGPLSSAPGPSRRSNPRKPRQAGTSFHEGRAVAIGDEARSGGKSVNAIAKDVVNRTINRESQGGGRAG